ncbi:MAG: transposase [Candidatus Heimdallarchaeota archaeon]|nr:transposase [Candidatus Heimdallarchaeota archaeon]
MIQVENNLQVKLHIRKFIVLDELIEDRVDPESSFYGNTVNEILEFYGQARSTYYYKKRKFRASGISGLIPTKPGPKSGRLPGQILYRIEDLRDLEMTTKNISSIISVESGRKLAESTTYYQIRKMGKSRLKRNKKKPKQVYTRFERSKPNEMWQLDNVGPFHKSSKFYAYNVIDDHSRLCLASFVSDNQTTESWIQLLEQLVIQYGPPEAILHDHGSQFVSNTAKRLTSKFKEFLDKYGIRSVRARVRHPQTCGKVERMQQRLQNECRDLVFTYNISELRDAFDSWMNFYNKVRPHSTTGMTPHERYYGKEADEAAKLTACQLYERSLRFLQEVDV